MATVIIKLTDGEEDEVGVQIAFDTPFNAESPAHRMAAEIMTDLSEGKEKCND